MSSPTTRIRTLYSVAMRQKRKMNSLSENQPDELAKKQYYELEIQLKETLKQILALNFTLLGKTQLINFLCLCSSHRPAEPWQVLTDLLIRWQEHLDKHIPK